MKLEVSPGLKTALEKLAEKRGVSLSEYIKEILLWHAINAKKETRKK